MVTAQNNKRVTTIKRVGSLNVRGIKKDYDLHLLTEDLMKYNIDILGIQETHLKGEGHFTIKCNKETYTLFHTGEKNNIFHGVGLVVNSKFNPCFNSISDRICKATIKLTNQRMHVYSAYAPTLSITNKDVSQTELFYEQLNSSISKIPSRDIVCILGDMNAKTGTAYHDFPENVGHFGKGLTNKNGEFLLDLALNNNLVLTNTMFKHKMSHRTTWQCPVKINECYHTNKEGQKEVRRNPYRNQIDYIIINKPYIRYVTNSRSYGGIKTNTDHKLVLAEVDIKRYKENNNNKSSNLKKIDLKMFTKREIKEEYNIKVETKYHQIIQDQANENEEKPQTIWNNITKICHETAIEVLGTSTKINKNSIDKEVIELSTKQQKLKNDIECKNLCNNQDRVRKMKTERNKILKQIHRKLEKEKEEQIQMKIETIEKQKSEPARMFETIKQLRNLGPKKNLILENEDKEKTTEPKEQVIIVTKYFKAKFTNNNKVNEEKLKIEPRKLEEPFTKEEIKKATTSMRNNKSAGKDNIHAEHIKYSPPIIHQKIADCLNKMAETGEIPDEINQGLLVPLQKPGKSLGPCDHLRPIILLSVLRKILAICLVRRTWEYISTRISRSQAAYQPGRSTTEQVFAMKILAEKALISENYKINILMLDMSKAFDTINRTELLKDLANILEPDLLHLMKLLIEEVKLEVKIKGEMGESFTTEVGVCQGDCISAILFIFYLSISLTMKSTEHDHIYARTPAEDPTEHQKENTITWSDLDVLIKQDQEHEFTIDPKYADDVNWISTKKERIQQIKQVVPSKLAKRNLQINQSKTEEFTITRNGNKEWTEKCKALGSYINTEKDIKNRKIAAIIAFNKNEKILKSKRITIETKLRIFDTYVRTTALYNSELWTMTKQLENTINTFQRNLLRRLLQIKWPETMRNEDLYSLTKQTPWATIIKKRRLSWLGHLMRMDKDTPARLALNEFLTEIKRPQGKPKKTWLQNIKEDLEEINIKLNLRNKEETLYVLQNMTQQREVWRNTIHYAMSKNVAA